MEERLQKIISSRAGISRRAAEKLIIEGKVTVNGKEASIGDLANEHDTILVSDSELARNEDRLIYIMLNKPVGYVTTMSDEKGRKTVRDLVGDIPERVYPVGRLDINSEGLLIMTNDGDFANRLMHPRYEKDKVYRVSVTGDVSRAIQILRAPMKIDGEPIRTPKVTISREYRGYTDLLITIHEGKNRQVRKMCENAGLKVSRLVRISISGVSLGGLKKGMWRYLTPTEILKLCSNK